ncbi:MBL fold metallo-hydrolase [Streptomyces murinus]|uniref:MBL fold metallo-hydrolase n=1 Tax=Streptomyces murinus TaxID=33900 RepID=UPI00380DA6B2
MLVLSAATGKFGTDVHIVAAGPGNPCLVIGPGHDSRESVLRGPRPLIEPDAILITHSHMDHAWEAVPLGAPASSAAWRAVAARRA